MISRIWAIAVNTFREAVRDRVLYGVLFLASLVLLFTLALGELSLDQQERVVQDVGFASISLFSVVIAIFLGSSLLYKEIERKTLYVILPKPIRRFEFLLGKYFGIVLTSVVFVLLMGSIQFLVMAAQKGASLVFLATVSVSLFAVLGVGMWRTKSRTSLLLPWSLLAMGVSVFVLSSSDGSVSTAMVLLTLTVAEIVVLTSVAILFSSFSTPFLTGALTFGVWLVGRSADAMVTMKSKAIGPELKSLLGYLAQVFPNFNLFVPPESTLSTGAMPYVLTTVAYALLYSVALLVLSSVIFQRRDFL